MRDFQRGSGVGRQFFLAVFVEGEAVEIDDWPCAYTSGGVDWRIGLRLPPQVGAPSLQERRVAVAVRHHVFENALIDWPASRSGRSLQRIRRARLVQRMQRQHRPLRPQRRIDVVQHLMQVRRTDEDHGKHALRQFGRGDERRHDRRRQPLRFIDDQQPRRPAIARHGALEVTVRIELLVEQQRARAFERAARAGIAIAHVDASRIGCALKPMRKRRLAVPPRREDDPHWALRPDIQQVRQRSFLLLAPRQIARIGGTGIERAGHPEATMNAARTASVDGERGMSRPKGGLRTVCRRCTLAST